MKFSEAVKPISYLKTHASSVLREVNENQKTMIITQNGEAKAVLLGVKEYERLQDSLALLKIVALGKKSVAEGRVKTASKAFQSVRKRIKR